MSPFITRSLRRSLHQRQERLIHKSIALGQNLEVAQQSWELFKAQGYVEERAADNGTDDVRDFSGDEDEELSGWAEKAEKVGRSELGYSPPVTDLSLR